MYKIIEMTDKNFDLNLLGKKVEFYSEEHYLNDTPYGYPSYWYPAILEGVNIIKDYYGFVGSMKNSDYEFALEFPTEIIISQKIRIKKMSIITETKIICDICKNEMSKTINRKPLYQAGIDLRIKLVDYQGNDIDYCCDCLKKQIDIAYNNIHN